MEKVLSQISVYHNLTSDSICAVWNHNKEGPKDWKPIQLCYIYPSGVYIFDSQLGIVRKDFLCRFQENDPLPLFSLSVKAAILALEFS